MKQQGDMAAVTVSARQQRPMQTLLRVAFGIAGLAVLILMVRHTGTEAILSALRPAWPFLPLAFACEAGRLAAESLATWYAFGTRARLLPIGMLLRAHLVASAVSTLMPAGRAAGEATKVALLCRYSGIPAATAAATTNQAVTLIAGGLISIPCAIAAWHLGAPTMIVAGLVIHAVAVTGSGIGVRVAARARAVGGRLSRLLSRFAVDSDAFQETSRELTVVPRGPTLAMLAGRLFQVVEYGVLAHAVGIDATITRAFYAQGVNMITLALGLFVPGQIGAAEGAFAYSARELGTTVAQAMSVALLAHLLQLVWIGLGSIALLLWRARERAAATAAASNG